jgi:hypothetical protein
VASDLSGSDEASIEEQAMMNFVRGQVDQPDDVGGYLQKVEKIGMKRGFVCGSAIKQLPEKPIEHFRFSYRPDLGLHSVNLGGDLPECR